MKPDINLPDFEESTLSFSMPSSLSSSSTLDSPNSLIDSSLTLSKSFDPFDYTYFNHLIPSPTTISTTSAPGTTCSSNNSSSGISSSLWTTQNDGLSYSTISYGGDMCDQDGEQDYAETDDYYPPHFLIDLDLLDDNAMDFTMGEHSEFEYPLSASSASKCRVGALSPSSPSPSVASGADTGTGPNPSLGTGGGMLNHHLLHLPYLFISSSSSSTSSTSSSSVTATVNIWSNNYYRYHDPFDDDEFDPTQPASSDISISPPFTYASTCQFSPSTTAIDMLIDLIPHYTQQEIVLTLSKANYDMDRFLELVSSGDGVASVSYSKKKQVCRHFLSGDCHRQDCRFAHDVSIKVCKFWLQGGCLKGSQCEFAHSLEPIHVRSQHDITTTRSTKSKSTKTKNKKSASNKSCTEDQQQQHHHYTDNSFVDDCGKQRRRGGRKKIKRKTKSSTNDNLLPTMSNNSEIRHSPPFVDYPLDEDFPTLLSSSKSSANSIRCPIHVPTMSSTNFAQVVARSKMKK